MNPLRTICLMACLLAVACATPNSKNSQNLRNSNLWSNGNGNSQKPSQWLTKSELQSLPSVDQISYQQLETMPADQGAKLISAIYHLSQINHDLEPTYVPSASNIPVSILRPNGQNVTVNLNQLPNAACQQSNFGDDEVTIFLTGVPQSSQAARKATKKLVQAYMQRYSAELQAQIKQGKGKKNNNNNNNSNNNNNKNNNNNNDYYNDYDETPSSSEEDYSQTSQSNNAQTGDLVVINLGQVMQPFKRAVLLDTEKTGAMIGDILVELTEKCKVPEEIVHLIGQGPAAHVSGAAGRRFKRQTGRSLRRITGLDPSKVYAVSPKTVAGLARGDADFVDAIHTCPYGMGTSARSGDVDFYPNGPTDQEPGTDNVIESSMRATRYFAESVRPGNERNFPAVPANCMKQYNNNNGQGPRAYMGIATEFDLEGDYILKVNSHSPFGQSSSANRQRNYHNGNGNGNGNGNSAWDNSNNNNNNGRNQANKNNNNNGGHSHSQSVAQYFNNNNNNNNEYDY